MSAEKYKSIIFFDFFRQKERREKSPNVLVIVYYMLNFLTIIPVGFFIPFPYQQIPSDSVCVSIVSARRANIIHE